MAHRIRMHHRRRRRRHRGRHGGYQWQPPWWARQDDDDDDGDDGEYEFEEEGNLPQTGRWVRQGDMIVLLGV